MSSSRFGIVTASALAALFALAPVASATESHDGPDCSFSGDDASATSTITEDNPVNPVAQAPVGDNNVGLFDECSTSGEDNHQGNNEGNTGVPAP